MLTIGHALSRNIIHKPSIAQLNHQLNPKPQIAKSQFLGFREGWCECEGEGEGKRGRGKHWRQTPTSSEDAVRPAGWARERLRRWGGEKQMGEGKKMKQNKKRRRERLTGERGGGDGRRQAEVRRRRGGGERGRGARRRGRKGRVRDKKIGAQPCAGKQKPAGRTAVP